MRILVTGGGTGIGRGIAGALVAAGHEVVLCGRRLEPLELAAAQLDCELVQGDVVADPEGIVARAGPLDHLINNAGVFQHQGWADWTADTFEALFRVHAVAPALLSQAFARQRGPGADRSIVNIGSTLSVRPVVGAGPYATAKAAMAGLTRSLAVELAPRSIRANCILPGVVRTEMTDAPRDGDDPEARLRALADLHLVGRLGQPADIGSAVLWLVGAPWVTGAVIPVDGGLSLS